MLPAGQLPKKIVDRQSAFVAPEVRELLREVPEQFAADRFGLHALAIERRKQVLNYDFATANTNFPVHVPERFAQPAAGAR